MPVRIEKKYGRETRIETLYTKKELDTLFGGNIVKAAEAAGRQAELSEALDTLNDTELPELTGRLDRLNSFLNDPEALADGTTYIEHSLLVDNIWAGSITALDGWFDKITTNQLFVDQLVANSVFADSGVFGQIFANNATVSGSLQSSNFLTGSDGWKINSLGDAEFNDIIVRGNVITDSSALFIDADQDLLTTSNVRFNDLELTGTINYVNETNLQVEDKTITVNKNGTDASSVNAGLIIERGVSADQSILWNATDGFVFSDGITATSGTATFNAVNTDKLNVNESDTTFFAQITGDNQASATTALALRNPYTDSNTATWLRFTNSTVADTTSGRADIRVTRTNNPSSGRTVMDFWANTDITVGFNLQARIGNNGLEVRQLQVGSVASPETVIDNSRNATFNSLDIGTTGHGFDSSGNVSGGTGDFSGTITQQSTNFLQHIIERSSAGATASQITFRKSRGSVGAETATISGDDLGYVRMGGHDGTSYVGARAGLRGVATQNYTGSAQGSRFDMYVTDNDSVTLEKRYEFGYDNFAVSGGASFGGTVDLAGNELQIELAGGRIRFDSDANARDWADWFQGATQVWTGELLADGDLQLRSFNGETLDLNCLVAVSGDLTAEANLTVDGTAFITTAEIDTLRTTLFKPNSISGMGGEFIFNGTSLVVSIDTGANTIVFEDSVFSNGDAITVSSQVGTSGFSKTRLNITSAGSAVAGGTQYSYTVDATSSGADTDIESGYTAVKVDGNVIYINANEGATNAPFIEGYSSVTDFELLDGTATPNWYIRNNEISVGSVFSADGNADTGTLAGFDFTTTTLSSLSASGGIHIDASGAKLNLYEDNGTTSRLSLDILSNTLTTSATVRASQSGTNTATGTAISIVDYERISGAYVVEELTGDPLETYNYRVLLQGHDGSTWVTIDFVDGTLAGQTASGSFPFTLQDKSGYTQFRLQVQNNGTPTGNFQFDSYNYEQYKSELIYNERGLNIVGGNFYLTDIPLNNVGEFNIDNLPSNTVYSDEKDASGNWILKLKA